MSIPILESPIKSHVGQLKIWHDPNRFKIFVCGRRWGKTVYFREKLLKKSCKPKSRNEYVAPTRQDAKDIMWDQLKERCFALGWIRTRAQINESELKITRLNRSTIQLKSAKTPSRFRGRGLDYIALDEAPEYHYPEIWSQAIRPSLSDRRGEADFGGTPRGFNWIYDLAMKAKTEDDWSFHTYKTIDSPFFQTEEGKKEIEAARRNLTERDFRQEYEASFENFAGRIYYAFDRNTCNTDIEYDRTLPIIVGMDFNKNPMTAALFQKHDQRNVLVQFDEIFLHASDTPEMCRVIRQKYGNSEIIARPDMTGSRSYSVNKNISDHQILREHNFWIQGNNVNPYRVDRWASVNRAFEKSLCKINVKNCPKTVRDLETICYKEGTCEPMLKDPMLGHIADAHGYAVHLEFPISGDIVVESYA